MSRIRFEWEVEADLIDQPDGEDPQRKRNRHRALRRLLILCALLIVACVLGGLALYLRIVQAQNEIAQQLTDTIKVEVAALRIGDRSAYLQIQSGDASWQAAQTALFERVQTLKAANAIELPGDILAMAIEGERARVLVREDVYGLPYARLSFYRREGGLWRHTAPDFSFWGEQQQIESEYAIVTYRDADADFASQLSAELEEWLTAQCEVADCADDAKLQVAIAPEAEAALAWQDAGARQALIRSPYLEIVRADTPFDSELAAQLYELIEEHWGF
ncbi:MAG: hypothetical protein F4W97_11345 [Chloroflexi bacterium]|nr:hypothetical protein [Chloroflexota bacterium]